MLIVGAGVVSAFQVGKAPVALDPIMADFGLDLSTASWLLSAFAVIGAVVGAPIGLAADHIGASRMVVGGLLLQGVASALGAFSTGAAALLLTRAVEGLGFLGVIVAAPALVVATAPLRSRDRALALWATFMPVGLTLIMLAAPLLSILEWRGFWLVNAAILLGYGALISGGLRVPPASGGASRRPLSQDIGEAVVAPGPWILGGLFAAFSAIFFIVFGFLPAILSDRLEIGPDAAGMLSALAVAASGIGNVACGQLLARGFRPARLLFASFTVMAACSFAIFADTVPALAAYALCVVFSLISGLIPVVIFDSMPRCAPRPELVGVTIGFAMQGNNIGLLVGPAAAGGIAATLGWPTVSLLVTMIAVAAMLLALPSRTGAQPTRDVAKLTVLVVPRRDCTSSAPNSSRRSAPARSLPAR